MRSFLRKLLAPLALSLACSQPALAAEEQPVRPALWKVADADTTIWLFGTVHALPPGIAWYQGQVATAFESSDELVTEIADTPPEAMKSIVLEKALLPTGKSLREQLPAEDRARFEAALADLKLPANALDRFEPWYAAITLATLPIMRAGYVADNGAETVLDSQADKHEHRRAALETAEYQLGLFDSMPAEVQQRYLMAIVKAVPELGTDLGRIVEAWKIGDADNLAKLMNENEDDPAVMEALLFKRNRAWADWVKARLDQPGNVFVAVGAGHLAGPGSVQEELALRGLTATRVQ